MDNYIQIADSIVSKYFKLYKEQHENTGVLLSGGIDSSVISSYTIEHFPNAILYSMGTDKTKDKPFVDLVSAMLHKPYTWVELTESSVQKALPTVKKLLIEKGIEVSAMQLALAVGYFLIFKRASENGVKAIVTGQGPDILFAGCHKYRNTALSEINSTIQKDLILLETDKKRDAAMAQFFDITLLNPYLEEEFVEFAMQVPGEYKMAKGIEKFFMREWGKERGLPQAVVARPKKAFQYSTGLQNMVMKIV